METDPEQALLNFAQCMRENGLPDFVDPTVDATGAVQWRQMYDEARIVVAPSSGVVVDVPAEGTRLERNARLFAIDSMVTDSQVTQAEQRIASAEASVASAEIALDDLESGAGPADLASAEAAVAQARLTLDNLTAAPTEAELGAGRAAVTRAQKTYDDLIADLDPTAMAEAAASIQLAEQRVGSTRAARDLSFVSLEIDQDLLALGTSVLIELPDDTEVNGEVIELGAVPVIVSATEQSNESSYLDVVIAPEESVDPNWTGATVQVHFATEVAQAVLSVPVSALLALQEGGYAVEIVQPDGSVRLVGVSTGLFADGFVEVAGNGLAPNLEVVIP